MFNDYSVNDALNILYRCGITTERTISNKLKVGRFIISDRSLFRKLKSLREGKPLIDGRIENGPSNLLEKNDHDRLEDLLGMEPELSAAEIRRKLRLRCSTRTIQRSLRLIGFKYLRIMPSPEFKNDQRERRVAFAEDHLRDHEWRSTFFLDESTFEAYSRKFACYQKSNKRVYKGRPSHPQSVHLIGMISARGPTHLIVFEGIMDGARFAKFLKILNERAQILYPDIRYRIYMDNDPKHTSSKAREVKESEGINVCTDWPSNSPDMNPIENVWGLMSNELRKLYPKRKEDLKRNIRSLWRKLVTRDLCERLVDSMPNRLLEVIARAGNKIDY